MKLAFRLGFLLTPFLLLLSHTAYPQGFSRCDHARARLLLSPVPPVTVALKTASRAPASLNAANQPHQRPARLGEFADLADRQSVSSSDSSGSYLNLVSESLRENTRPALPLEGSGIGAQASVFHFGN